MTEMQIVSAIQSRATTADTFEFTDFSGTPSVDITCSNTNKSCSGNVPDVGTLTFSLAGIEDLSLVDDMGFMDFDSETQVVMMDGDATIIQSQAAMGQSDGTRLSFQSYGGWLTNTVFGVQRLDVLEAGETTTRYASFNFGKESGNNPTGTGTLQWNGVMVGTDTTTGDVIQGDMNISDIIATPNDLDQINFLNVKNLNTGRDVTFNNVNTLQFVGLTLTNGSFESANGEVRGSFYGMNHGEVGGILNSSTYNIIGAFAGKK